MAKLPNDARMAWKDLKQKVNISYYLGGPRFGALDEAIGEPDAEPAAPKPKAKAKAAASTEGADAEE